MRCSGKTTVGRLLAEELERPFLDSDEELARRFGAERGAGELLAEWGEARFRREEWRTLHELLNAPDSEFAVIATGGGAVTDPFSRELLGRRSLGIYLEAKPDVLRSRAAGDRSPRPSLTRNGRILELEDQLSIRAPLYLGLANVVIDASSAEPKKIVRDIKIELQRSASI